MIVKEEESEKMDKRQFPIQLSALAISMLVVTPLVPANGMMTLSVCGADGVIRTVSVPVDREQEDRNDCVKACHGFCSRKQFSENRDDAKN
ncbi:hypothetical protein [Parasphingorhabdus cellanae]|uniref:Secreted protein n=1 Tax=Parasphingorhabdus cellanae TaxID=2806553 RepID=A0ABX7T5Y4_9SPHN|nr:hypothetical protein [Parasphingorhabdus cellanae]QTD56993.1 hypothetical protein J4G78_05335 [Parasphingorhabdus cellanae]